jgi:hypothetical protein
MLITSKFIVLNLPKTGSSFVRSVLKRIYRRRRWRLGSDAFIKELLLPRGGGRLPGRDQHGKAFQIPPEYRHLPVVSVIRNPYDKLLSEFEFRWWAEHPSLPVDELKAAFPHFPDLSLDDYVDLLRLGAERRLNGANPRRLGRQTIQFASFFFHDPEQALARLSDDYIRTDAFREDLVDVTLLRQERLNDELACYLHAHGFALKEVALCRTHKPVNVTKAGTQPRRELWTPRARKYVAHEERFLLAMLGRMGISYSPPD